MRLFWGIILITRGQKRLVGPEDIFNLVLYGNFKDIHDILSVWQMYVIFKYLLYMCYTPIQILKSVILTTSRIGRNDDSQEKWRSTFLTKSWLWKTKNKSLPGLCPMIGEIEWKGNRALNIEKQSRMGSLQSCARTPKAVHTLQPRHGEIRND